MASKESGSVREKLSATLFRSNWMKVVTVMSCLIVFITTYALVLPAITMSSQDANCGFEEHEHTAECYDAENNLVCGLTEHTHTLACYSDPNADIENWDEWLAGIPELTGDRNADIVAVAASQVGYRESDNNYLVNDENQTQGYTRYGQWYGDVIDGSGERLPNGLSEYAYADWDAIFVSFVLDQAGVSEFGSDIDAGNWAGALIGSDLYQDAADYTPKAGDLIFFTPEAGANVQVGIITDVNKGFLGIFGNKLQSFSVIIGNSNNSVEDIRVAVDHQKDGDITFESIHGYGVIPSEEAMDYSVTEEIVESTIDDFDVEQTVPGDETIAEQEAAEIEQPDQVVVSENKSTEAPVAAEGENYVTEQTDLPADESVAAQAVVPADESAATQAVVPADESGAEQAIVPADESGAEQAAASDGEAVAEQEAVLSDESVAEEAVAGAKDEKERDEYIAPSLAEDTEHIIGKGEEDLDSAVVTEEGGVAVSVAEYHHTDDGSAIIMNWQATAQLEEDVLPAGAIIRVDASTGKKHAMTVAQAKSWGGSAVVFGENTALVDNDNYEITFIGDNGNLYTWADVQNMSDEAVVAFTGIHVKVLKDVTGAAGNNSIDFAFETTAKIADANVGLNYYVTRVSVDGKTGTETFIYKNGEAVPTDQDRVLQDAGLNSDPDIKELTVKKSDYAVTMSYGPEAEVPEGAKLYVKEIKKGTEEYNAYIEEAKAALGINGIDEAELLGRFFDIKIMTKDGEFEPKAPVNVNIEYRDAIETEDASYVSAVHFSEDGAESIPVDTTDISVAKDEMAKVKAVEFSAESFSVYGVVYTVDFYWEVDGKTFEFSLPGGGFVSFTTLMEILGVAKNNVQSENEEQSSEAQNTGASVSEPVDSTVEQDDSAIILNDIHISEETRKFVAEVEKVEFSSPELVWIGKIDENTTVGQIKDEYKLECEYSYRLTWDEIVKINDTAIETGDWGIISLKAFDTNEQLKVTMKDGHEFIIKVTDYALYEPVENDGVTIPNPNGTTINLFDYWVDSSLKDRTGKYAWTGYNGGAYNYGYSTTYHNGQELMGNGNNSGINSWSGNTNEGHALKFNPSDHYTVIDGNYNNWSQRNVNGASRINSWQGDADPLQGIVQPTLNSEGYPTLTNNSNIGTNGEKLNYLFDGTSGDNMGKAVHPGVDGLLYVDRDGYYTYDSRDFTATYNGDTAKTFTLAPQTAAEGSGPRGFWPFGSEKFWFGMHMKVDFSMPSNGQVLNPSGVYKDMEFSFSGDDDTWIYVDGVLVGDGGGVHNRTEIDINFRTGTVYVTGKNDPSYTGTFERTTYLEDYYRNAGRFDASQWTEVKDDSGNTVYRTVNGQRRPVLTFKDGSGHDLQMFYMERGGGFSNLMIHYNLISTTDFSAHKSYHNSNGSILRRNDYKFELVGYDNPEYASEGDEFVKAIMPDAVTYDASKPLGTFENPLWQTVASSGTTDGYRSVTIGNTEDGNVNFGNKEISSAYAGKQYRYMVREIVPDNAVNPDGVRWADASEDLREEGGFVLNGITYDSRVYYYIGKVVEEPAGSGKYTLKKERYLDPECTIPDTETKFFSFVNGEERPVTFKVIKKSDTNTLLDGAVFSLTRAMEHHHDNKWVVREYTLNNATQHSIPVRATSSQGVLTFPNLVEGHYILEELAAPAGYAMGTTHRWLLTLQKEDSTDKILLVPYITPLDEEGNPTGARVALNMPDANNTFQYEVLNGPLPPIDLSLEKKWNDNGDTSVPDGAEATFELHRIRTISPVKVELLDKNGNKLSEVLAFVGDVIKIYDSGDNAFKHYIQTPNWMALFQGNTRSASDNVNPSDSGWTISTNNRYSSNGYNVYLDNSTTTSSGQYTVKQSDVTAGVIQLKLTRTYQGGTNNDRFDKTPVLYVSNSTVNSTTVDETIATFTLKELNGDGDPGNAWKKSFADLPVVDTDGHPYTYYFTEVSHSPLEYNIQTVTGNMGSASSPLSTDSAVVVTNNTPDKPKIIASKAWKDSAGNAITDETGLQELEVKLTLFKGTNLATSDDTKNAITQTVTGNGEAVWMLKDPNADVSQYSVKETAVKIPGGDFVDVTSNNPFGGTVTGDSTNGYTVTNQLPTTGITVTKQWKDGTSANADRVFDETKTISFAVYQKLGDNDGSLYMSAGQAVTGTVTYTPASGGTAASWSTETIQNLPKYVYSDGSWIEATYYPVETGDMSNVRISYQKSGGDATESPDAAAVSSGTVIIINTDIVVPLKIVKVDAKSKEGLTGAKFQLTRKLSGEGSFTNFVHSSFDADPENDNKKTGPFTVSSTEGIILEGLLPGEYRIEEKEAPAGYIISLQPFTFTVSEDGTVASSDADGKLVLHLKKSGSDPEGYQISNEPGAALPNTGGPGTTALYLLGIMLTALAGAGLVMRKRRRDAA